ncbi:hypothetical protein C4D60_Mb02t06140 [Musa balbisiana]|uniref:Protein kinase domain-containing protein n=1 Tax=Musa balbisiana TaxID=52838 RepID=A0A4S8I8M3_MUSBA|nr:hypothetical protein C4D60_Mb02t06140 [Musa balbisiana]
MASKAELQARFSASVRSNSTTSTECNVRRSGPEFNTGDVSSIGADSMGRSLYPSFSQIPSNLRVFTFSELRNATRNFSRSLMVGEGGFGCVYRGTIKSFKNPTMRIEIAGHREWLNEVNVLGVVEHPNLVKLIGYCAEDDERGIQRLLVYEYMPNGSVEDHLSRQFKTILSWSMRLRVALDAARGLTYLHEQMDFQIIFRDFKSSNILLDKDWNAKLSDFGLARQGPTEGISHVSTAVVGTLGYAAPEYMQTGRLTAKSDIWSYGVFLYELLTGRQPIDIDRPKGEQKLLEWVKPYISDVRKFRIIMDTRLAGEYSFKSATKLASVANRCLRQQPKSRPKMSEVLEMVQQIVGSTGAGVPQAPLRNSDLEQGHPRVEKKEVLRTIGEQKKGQGMQLVWQGCSDTQLNAFKTGKAEALEAIPNRLWKFMLLKGAAYTFMIPELTKTSAECWANRSVMLPGWKSSHKVGVIPPSLGLFVVQKLKFQLIAVCKSSSFRSLRLPKHGSMSAIRFPPERKNGKLRLH